MAVKCDLPLKTAPLRLNRHNKRGQLFCPSIHRSVSARNFKRSLSLSPYSGVGTHLQKVECYAHTKTKGNLLYGVSGSLIVIYLKIVQRRGENAFLAARAPASHTIFLRKIERRSVLHIGARLAQFWMKIEHPFWFDPLPFSSNITS